MRIFKPVMQALFVFILLFSEAVAVFTPVYASEPTVSGNTVSISTPEVYIEATPSTLTSSGWVEVLFWTRNYEGSVDIVYGFNGLDGVQVAKSEVWESYQHTKTRQVDVVKTATFKPDRVISTKSDALRPTKADTDLSLNSKYTEVVVEYTNPMSRQVSQETIKLAYDSFDAKTGAYTYKYNGKDTETYYETYADWNPKEKPSSSILSYAESTKWDVASYKSVTKDQLQRARVWIDIPFNGTNKVSGKYNIGIKPSNLTLQQAKDQNKLWLLDPWYNAAWSYRKELTIVHTDDGAQSNYPVKITVHYGGLDADDVESTTMELAIVHTPSASVGDFDDLRFTKSDEVTLLPYWIESSVASTSAVVWINVDSIAAHPTDTTIYMYYGNAGAAAYGLDRTAGKNTFTFFDDFSAALDAEWVTTGVTSVAGGILTVGDATHSGSALSVASYGTNRASRMRSYLRSDTDGWSINGFVPSGAGAAPNFTGWIAGYAATDLYPSNYAGAWTLGTNRAALLGAYHIYDTKRNAGTDTRHVYDSSVSETLNTNVPAGNLYFGSVAGYFAHDVRADTDWALVRNYTVNEPSWGTFGLETSSTATNPTVTTGICSGIGTTWAILNGNITNDGGSPLIERGFDYGLTGAYGSSSTGTGTYTTGAYYRNLTGLLPSTTYHYRAKASNGSWAYGADAVFSTKGSPALTTYLNTGDDTCMSVYGQTVAAQTFTTSASTEYSVTSVRLLLSRTLLPGTVTVSIRKTAGGAPTGVDLTSGTLNGSTIDTSYTWYDVTMSTEKTLELNTMYAIIVSAPSGDSSNYICWRYSSTGGLANGEGVTSADSGVTWSDSPIKFCGLGASVSDPPLDDEAWSDPTNIYTHNSAYASVTAAAYDTGDFTEVLKATTFGFAVPAAATITGIEVKIDRFCTAGGAKDKVVQLTKDGTTRVGTDAAVATAYPATSTVATYGGAASLWGVAWTPAEVNSANFGVHLSVEATGDDTDVYVDYITITVYYSYDYMFEIYGNTALEIQDAKVFQTYKETGDWLITVRYVNTYAPYYDTYDIKKYFQIQLVDAAGNVKATSALPSWGNRVGSVYLSATSVTPLTYGGAYRVRIQGTFTGTPYTEYALVGADWMGDDLVNLDSWIRTSATVIGTYYSTALTTYIVERGECLNSTGATIFNDGIAGCSQVRPAIFQTYTTPSSYTRGTITQSYRQSIDTWQTNIGADGTVMLTRLGNIVGIGGDIVSVIAFLIMIVVLAAMAFPAGQTTAAMALSLPMLAAAIWFGMDLLYLLVLALVAAFLFVKNFWLDKGN